MVHERDNLHTTHANTNYFNRLQKGLGYASALVGHNFSQATVPLKAFFARSCRIFCRLGNRGSKDLNLRNG